MRWKYNGSLACDNRTHRGGGQKVGVLHIKLHTKKTDEPTNPGTDQDPCLKATTRDPSNHFFAQ